MNKKLIVASVVAALTAPVASYAVDATLYGSIRAGLVSGDDDGADSDRELDLGATGNDGNLNGQGLYSRIGVKGSADLGNGMSAGLHLERGVGDDALTTRHTNVWVSGGFGKLTFGQQGNPYRSARHWDQSYFLGGQYGFGDGGSRIEGIRYDMSSGPFNLSIMATANDSTSDTALVTGTEVSGVTPTTTAGVEYDDGVDSWVIAAGYDFGVATLNVAHRSDNNEIEVAPAGTSTAGADAAAMAANTAAADTATIKVLDAAVANNARTSDNTAIGVKGKVGSLDWYLAYQTSADNSDGGYENDVDSIGGFLGFRVSDSDTLYAYHVSHDADRISYDKDGDQALGESVTETILGYSHSFGAGVTFIAEYLTVDKDLESGVSGSEPDTLVLAMKVDF